MQDVRCSKCNKLLGKLTTPYEVKCTRCGTMNEGISKQRLEAAKNGLMYAWWDKEGEPQDGR